MAGGNALGKDTYLLPTPERINIALQMLEANKQLSVRAAARSAGIPEATLRSRLDGRQSYEEAAEKRRKITIAESQAIAVFAGRMQDLHFPLTPEDVRLEAQRILHAREPLASEIGGNWYSRVFLKDNPQMRNKRGKGYDRARALCASRSQISNWYDDVRIFLI